MRAPQFFKDADGSFAGNIRLFDPAVLGSKVRECVVREARSGGRPQRTRGVARSGWAGAAARTHARHATPPPRRRLFRSLPARAQGDGSLAAVGAGAGPQVRARARARGDGLSRLLGSFDAAAADGGAAGVDASGGGPYARYTSLLSPASEPGSGGGGGGVKPKPRQLSWVMRHVEELYDARYAKDTADLRGDAGAAAPGGSDAAAAPVPFPAFVVEFFTKRYGLRSLIDQTCWDLLASVQALGGAHPEVALFGRFLREECDPDDLLFFLYVRSVAQKELGVSFRARWTALSAGNAAAGVTGGGAPAPLSLTPREAGLVARVVYGSEADPLYRSFMATVEEHMAAAAPAAGGAGGAFGASLRPDAAASRRGGAAGGGGGIDVTAFLTLSLEDYHATRPDAAAAAAPAASAAAQQQQRGAGGAPPSTGSSFAPPSEGLLAALGEAIHASNERLITRLLLGGGEDAEAAGGDEGGAARGGGGGGGRAAGFASLPDDLRGNIVGELQAQLEGKVDAVLAGVIEAAQAAPAGGAGAGAEGELCGLFAAVLASGGGDAALLDAFCDAVLAHEDVREPMADLATVMVSYAVAKWHGGGGGGGGDAAR